MQAILENITTWPDALVYPGDFTGDQWLTLDDINLFKQAVSLGNETVFDDMYPTTRYLAGDFDGNGIVDSRDMPGLIAALQHAGVPADYISMVPEPGSFAIAVAGLLVLAAVTVRRRQYNARRRAARRRPAPAQLD